MAFGGGGTTLPAPVNVALDGAPKIAGCGDGATLHASPLVHGGGETAHRTWHRGRALVRVVHVVRRVNILRGEPRGGEEENIFAFAAARTLTARIEGHRFLR